MSDLRFTGERLVAGPFYLEPLRVENLARFNFFRRYASGPRLLDLGCGAGDGTHFLCTQTDWSVIGIDLSYTALANANQQHRPSGTIFCQMNANSLAFSNESFDSIISVEVIEHLEDPAAYLAEARRVLRSEGLFMLTTPNQLRTSPTPGSLWPWHVKEYAPEELVALLRQFFSDVVLWGESIPVYESHPVRKFVGKLAPYVKPILPRWLRTRALPVLQSAIKAQLELEDIVFSQQNIEQQSTLVALCRK